MRACCINYLHLLKIYFIFIIFFAEFYHSGLLRRSTTSSASIVSFLPFLPANGTEQRSCCIQWQDETRWCQMGCSGSPQLKMKVARACESGCVQLCSWNFQIWNLPEGLRLSPDTISHNSAIGVSSWSTACALQLAMTQSVSSDLFSALTELCWIGLRWCFCWYFWKSSDLKVIPILFLPICLWKKSPPSGAITSGFNTLMSSWPGENMHSDGIADWCFTFPCFFKRQALRLQSVIFHLSWHVRTINIPTEHF